jgi:hypothetical protein
MFRDVTSYSLVEVYGCLKEDPVASLSGCFKCALVCLLKVNFALQGAMEAQRGSTGMALLFV